MAYLSEAPLELTRPDGLLVAKIGPGLSQAQFLEAVPALLKSLFPDVDLLPIGKPNTLSRVPGQPRDAWSPDHLWHADQSYVPLSKRPFATVLYASEIEGDVADTEFLDTSVILGRIKDEDPTFAERLSTLRASFAWSSYFDKSVQELGDEAKTAARKINAVDSLSAIATARAMRYPAQQHPIVVKHPLTGKDCLYFDERVMGIIDVSLEESSMVIERLRSYFHPDMTREDLEASGYYYRHEWSVGEVGVFTNVGTLHRALPGNDGRRVMHRTLVR